MSIEKLEATIARAEQAHNLNRLTIQLDRARDLLAKVALEGTALDPKRIEALILRIGERTKNAPVGTAGENRRFIKWAALAGALVDYLESGGVPMADGRVATASGWNYENCPPVDFTVVMSRETYARLMAHCEKLVDQGEHENLRISVIETAVKEYLDRQE